MLWGRKNDQQPADADAHPSAANVSVPDTKLRRRKLPPELQKLVDHEEEFLDQLYDGYSADTTETPYRYAAYATRIRTILLSAHRYVAYTSDIGESFRPVAHPYLVRCAYGISWAYIFGDVANEGYKAYLRNRRVLAPPCDDFRNATHVTGADAELDAVARQKRKDVQTFNSTACGTHPQPWNDPEEDTWTPWSTRKIPLSEDYRSVMAERAVFQGIASMGLPAFTIHSVVKYSGRAMKGVKNNFIRTWSPIGLGLAVVPFLPYLFDKPVEEAVQWTFHQAFSTIGGPDAVPHAETENTTTSQTLQTIEQMRQQQKAEHDRLKAEKKAKEKTA